MSSNGDPKSLGKVAVANAGTPVPVKASSFVVRVVTFQADPGNTGTNMIIKDATGNIMAKIAKGQSFTPPTLFPLSGNGVDLNSIQLDTDSNGDGCFVSYV